MRISQPNPQIPGSRRMQKGQAMLEFLIIASTLILVMFAFGAVVNTFMDHGYRTLRLTAMEYP
jgi:Flp pilus assembly protein TadG